MRIGIEGRYIIAFNGKEHRLLENGIVVFEDDKIIHVGKSYSGQLDKRINTKKRLVMPGLINTHCHSGGGGVYERGFRGDRSDRVFFNSDLFNRSIAYYTSATKVEALLGLQVLYVLGLLNGNTTFLEMGSVKNLGDKKSVDVAGGFGVRAYLNKSYKSGDWYSDDGRNVQYENFDGEQWDETQGNKELTESLSFIKKYNGAYEDRIRSFLYPDCIVMCSPQLLKETRRVADEEKLLITSHISESSIDVYDSIKRYGKPPIEAMADLGLLGDDFIAGHAIYVSGHSKLDYSDPLDTEIRLLSESGSSVAHCPRPFARYGYALESFSKYLRMGVNVGIGTDTFPQEMLREMRLVSFLSKHVDGDPRSGSACDVFSSATLGGAKALHRPDLGRIEKGAKADIVVIKLDTLNMSPVVDPIFNLIQVADRSDVDQVIVDGKTLVENGEVIDFDLETLLDGLQKAQDKILERVPINDRLHRTPEEINPWSMKKWE
ncbi:amidohydrolase family protein [Thermoproteota archaeon]